MTLVAEKFGNTGESKDAVSEVFGTILILGIVLTALALIVVVGTVILNDLKTAAQYSGSEQALTMADSRLSKARFSTAIYQEAPLALRDGTVYVNDSWDDSHILIYDYNVTSKTSKLIYNGTIGTIKCVTDQGEVAYQDGGVWIGDGKNGSLMISPPDFDYNGVTLTLPLTQIRGNESISSSENTVVYINANASNAPAIIYPQEGKFGNPLPQNHSINITIKSDYYDAWANYINERTRAVATTNPAKKTVNITLDTGTGTRTGPAVQGFDTSGMDAFYNAPIQAFDLHLVPKNPGNEYTVTFGVKDTAKKSDPVPNLEITVSRTKGDENHYLARLEIKYTDDTRTEIFEGYTLHDRKAEETMDLDMVSHDETMEYISGTRSSTWGKDPNNYDYDPLPEYTEFDDPYYRDVDPGGKKTMFDVLEHYLTYMANVDQQNSDEYGGPEYAINSNNDMKFDESQSTINLVFQASQDVKYLYITDGVLTTHLDVKS